MGEGLEGFLMMSSRLVEIPVSVTPTDAIRAIREIGEHNNWKMRRLEEAKMVNRWAIVMPISKMARVLGISVEDGEAKGFSMRVWSHTPGSAGKITKVSFEIPIEIDGEIWTKILNQWVSRFERCPWKWSFGERSMIGYFQPEFYKSKSQLKKEGIDITKWDMKSNF
ncbi:MAG: hypothetical protein CMA13_04060 [Euryarchaeota archaeon]|mgnify:FL=1|nr:hypothetical protein [Euryarchaeota archaeon]OUV25486.1 MAG: hypothetical protein CBC57_05140 [Euryarchaeota archaeon TMED97]|tara:strand:+ start:161 stop:661 length:501 start_codon:yes stop_codon:yes gene_type:complete